VLSNLIFNFAVIFNISEFLGNQPNGFQTVNDEVTKVQLSVGFFFFHSFMQMQLIWILQIYLQYVTVTALTVFYFILHYHTMANTVW